MAVPTQDRHVPGDRFRYERIARGDGYTTVAGIDEAGRGPLAGPVVAAAVVLPGLDFDLPVADSKTLPKGRREELAALILDLPDVHVGIGVVSCGTIDRINILRATHEAMRRAVAALPVRPDCLLVDGLAVEGLPAPARFIVKGDSLSASIAAASIVAKVHRDRLMAELDVEFPGYGFSRNSGYGTGEHLEALTRLGPCPAHRRSFAPVRRVAEPGPTQQEFMFGSEPAAGDGGGPRAGT